MSSCKNKPIGTQELVFITIKKIIPKATSTTLVMEHCLTGRSFEHTISKDKLKYRNIYKYLEEGKTYIVVETLEAPMRWVYTQAVECNKTQCRTFFNMCGISPDEATMEKASAWLKSQLRPEKTSQIPAGLAAALVF